MLFNIMWQLVICSQTLWHLSSSACFRLWPWTILAFPAAQDSLNVHYRRGTRLRKKKSIFETNLFVFNFTHIWLEKKSITVFTALDSMYPSLCLEIGWFLFTSLHLNSDIMFQCLLDNLARVYVFFVSFVLGLLSQVFLRDIYK